MSLQVWLPLTTNNLKQQGLSNLTFKNTDTTNTAYNTSGKLGGCFENKSLTAGGLVSNETVTLGINQSIFCWIYVKEFNSSSNFSGVVGQHRYQSNCGMGLNLKYLSATTGKLSISTGNGTSRTYNTYTGNTTLNANTWYHVGYTYDGSTIRFYVNGVLDGTTAITNMSVPADYISVFAWSVSGTTGNAVYGNYKSKMLINDVRIYDHTLSVKEISELTKGLVCNYKMEYVLGTDESDVSGNGYNATIGSPSTLNTNISTDSKRYNTCYNFTSTSEYLVSPTIQTSGFSNSFTISWWSKNTNMSGQMAWGFADGNRLNMYPSGAFCWNTGDGASNPFVTDAGANISFSPYNGGWHHYAVTGNGTVNKFYIDGVYMGHSTTYKGITGTQIYISGWSSAVNYRWIGQMSDFRLYSTVLSDSDIAALYKTMFSIDNHKNLFSGELYEDDAMSFRRTGVSEVNYAGVNVQTSTNTHTGICENTDEAKIGNGYTSFNSYIEM